MTIQQATEQEIQAFLDELDSWTVKGDKLHREYKSQDFVQAFGFMAQAALLAERADHHPEWCNIYNRVVVDLQTHEAQGITEKEFGLARGMERIARALMGE